MSTEPSKESTKMLTALVRLRSALQEISFPLDVPGVEDQRAARAEMVDQLEDYVIPRLMTIDAPLLTVVGGSTGAGKSRSEERRVGKEGVSTCRFRWSPYH